MLGIKNDNNESHIVYVHKNTIYDIEPIEYRSKYYDYKVKEFLMKESD